MRERRQTLGYKREEAIKRGESSRRVDTKEKEREEENGKTP